MARWRWPGAQRGALMGPSRLVNVLLIPLVSLWQNSAAVPRAGSKQSPFSSQPLTLITVVRLFVCPPLCTRWSTVETTVQLPAAPARPSREYPPRYSSAVITVPIRGSLVHSQHVRLVLLVVLVGFINFQLYHATVPLALVRHSVVRGFFCIEKWLILTWIRPAAPSNEHHEP